MHIKQIMLKNFASVNQIELNLSDSITYLIGENGAGKTTVGLNSIWFILEGLAQKGKNVLHGERFRFIGPHAKSAMGQLVLHDDIENIDITISRKLLKNKTELKITASDNRQLSDTFIDDIFNLFTINPVGFAKLSPQDQAVALGIDTSEYDVKKKIAYDERTDLGREVKRLEGVVAEIGEIEEIEPVDLKALLLEKKHIDSDNEEFIKQAQFDRDKKIQANIEHNKTQDERARQIKNNKLKVDVTLLNIKDIESKINEYTEMLENETDEYERLVVLYNELLPPENQKPTDLPLECAKRIDTSTIIEKIESAEETNKKAADYQKMVEAKEKMDIARTVYTEKQMEMNRIEDDRINYIKSCNLPFSEITVDDSGGILIGDRPFSETYFSKGEILKVGIKLAAATNPKLKYIFIPDSQCIDEKNREELFQELVDSGFQVVAEFVDIKKQKDHGSILIKESQLVETYENDNDEIEGIEDI